MMREESKVAERFRPRVDPSSDERPVLGDGLKTKLLGHWSRKIGLWSKKVTLLQQFVIYTVAVLGLTMAALGTWMSARIVDGVLGTSAAAATLYMGSFVEPHVQSLHDGETLSSDDLANLEKISRDFALRRHIQSIKVWRPDGTILFSQRKDLIGKKFNNVPIQSALNGSIRVAPAELGDEDNEFERALSMPLYEIFAPLYRNGTGNIIAVAEFYQSAHELLDKASAVRNSWLIVAASSLGLFIVLYTIVYRGSAKIAQQRSLLGRRLREQARLQRVNSQLEKRIRDALTESARIDDLNQRRLGAELHDGPAQLVALILLRLDEIGDACSGKSPVVDELRQVAAEALKDIRTISSDLFLPNADGLADALRRVIRNHERRTNSVVALSLSNIPEQVSIEVMRCVGRVVQEALNNCFKHAHAANQAVSAAGVGRALIISIKDSGPGVSESNSPATERLGLKGMQYRVEALGGVFQLKSQPGSGTEVWCKVPLNPPGKNG